MEPRRHVRQLGSYDLEALSGRARIREALVPVLRQQVADELGGLPKTKMHCSNLAVDAVQKAIKNYLTENNRSLEELEN